MLYHFNTLNQRNTCYIIICMHAYAYLCIIIIITHSYICIYVAISLLYKLATYASSAHYVGFSVVG